MGCISSRLVVVSPNTEGVTELTPGSQRIQRKSTTHTEVLASNKKQKPRLKSLPVHAATAVPATVTPYHSMAAVATDIPTHQGISGEAVPSRPDAFVTSIEVCRREPIKYKDSYVLQDPHVAAGSRGAPSCRLSPVTEGGNVITTSDGIAPDDFQPHLVDSHDVVTIVDEKSEDFEDHINFLGLSPNDHFVPAQREQEFNRCLVDDVTDANTVNRYGGHCASKVAVAEAKTIPSVIVTSPSPVTALVTRACSENMLVVCYSLSPSPPPPPPVTTASDIDEAIRGIDDILGQGQSAVSIGIESGIQIGTGYVDSTDDELYEDETSSAERKHTRGAVSSEDDYLEEDDDVYQELRDALKSPSMNAPRKTLKTTGADKASHCEVIELRSESSDSYSTDDDPFTFLHEDFGSKADAAFSYFNQPPLKASRFVDMDISAAENIRIKQRQLLSNTEKQSLEESFVLDKTALQHKVEKDIMMERLNRREVLEQKMQEYKKKHDLQKQAIGHYLLQKESESHRRENDVYRGKYGSVQTLE